MGLNGISWRFCDDFATSKNMDFDWVLIGIGWEYDLI
jgi:hypothetical protein